MADEETKEGQAAAPKPAKPAKQKGEKPERAEKVATEYGDDFKHLVRLAATDLKGTKTVVTALTGVKGVGIRLAPLVADKAGVARAVKIGTLTDEQIEELQAVLDSVAEEVPPWMVNRQRDIDSGENLHLIGVDIDVLKTDDINRLKKIRSYRGARHEAGLPVRGQRTRSNGRTGMTVGVIKKKEAAPSG